MTTIKLRRDTAANWLAADPVLALAEPGLETDTGRIKYGDGTSEWSALPYAGGESPSTRWDATPTEPGNNCPIYAELTPDHFQAFTQQSNLGIRNDGSWNIGSNYNGTGLYGSGNTATLYSNYGDVAIRVNESQSLFIFGADGKLTLPDGQSIGSGSLDGIKMTTDRGTVLFGNSPECVPTLLTHFHIMKQDASAVDLFLGDDNNYVKLPGSGETAYGVEIGTNTGTANLWRFGTDGTLTMPDGSNGNGAINFTWEGHNWASISSSESTLSLYSLDVVRGDPKTNINIGGYIELTTNALDSAHTWTFKDDGTIQFPGNTLANSHDSRLFITADRYIEIDSDENVLLQYNNPNVTLAPGEIFNSGFNAGEDGLLDLGTGPFMFATYTPDGDHIEEVSYWGISPQGNFKTSILQLDSQKFDEYSIRTGDIVDYYDQSIIHPVAGDTPPLGATDGRLWFKSDEARLYIMYGNQWIDASPTVVPPPMTTPVVESITFNDDTVQTTAWPGTYSYNNLTDKPGDPALIDGGNAYTALEPI